MRIAVRVDASERIGAGHVMRCLTLADELKQMGCAVRFVCATILPDLVDRIEKGGHELRLIETRHGGADAGGWDTCSASSDHQLADAAATTGTLGEWPADWLVVDHYRLDQRWERGPRQGRCRLMVVDDLANRPHDCDLLVDQTVGREAADYRDLVPGDAELLTGSAYALLRPAFAALRPEAIERRRSSQDVRRILVSLGMTDVGGVTVSAVKQVLAATPGCAIDVVIGSAAPSFEQVQDLAARHDLVTLHVNSERMCELMAAADLAVGAAGTTSWERCCLGLPTVTLAVSPNQRTIACKLAEAGAVQLVETAGEDEIASALQRLASDPALRDTMTSNGLRLCDGEGTRRVAKRLLSARSAPSSSGQLSWNR